MEIRKNKNRGYKKLRVWNDAIEYYKLTYDIFKKFPFELKRIVSQQIAAADSIHRNIAEGYCRRSIKEYLNFLNIAISSLGESVSALVAYKSANHLTEEQFQLLDAHAYKLENGMLRLVESLEKKKESGEWIDQLMVKDINHIYKTNND